MQKRTVGLEKRGLRGLCYPRHSCLSDYPFLSVQPLVSLPIIHLSIIHQCLNIHPLIYYPFTPLHPHFLLFSNIPGTLGIRNTKMAGMLFLPPRNSVCLSVTCLTAVTKSLARTPDRRKGLFLAYSSRGHVHHGGEGLMAGAEGSWTHCVHSEEVGRDDCSFPGILGRGTVPLAFRMPLYTPVTVI